MTGRRRLRRVSTAVLIAALASGCRHQTAAAIATTTADAQVHADANVDDGVSIFALTPTFVDQDGQSVPMRALGGHVLIASMVYTTCPTICPRVIDRLQALDAHLAPGPRADVRYVLFSLDPEHDTPPVMRRFMSDRRLDADRWRLLASSDDDVRDLAALLGVKYARSSDGQIAHSALVVVIDRTGVVRYRQTEIEADGGRLEAAVRSVAE